MLPVLLHRIFQWDGTDRIRDGAGHCCRLSGPDPGFLVYEQADTRIAVSHRAWNSVLDRAADPALLWVHGSHEKEMETVTLQKCGMLESEYKMIAKCRFFKYNKGEHERGFLS